MLRMYVGNPVFNRTVGDIAFKYSYQSSEWYPGVVPGIEEKTIIVIIHIMCYHRHTTYIVIIVLYQAFHSYFVIEFISFVSKYV